MKNTENNINNELFNMEGMTVYRNVDGKLEEAKKVEKEELKPTTFRLRAKSLERFEYLYEQQTKNKGEFASDVIDSFFKWFAVDMCVTKEDLEVRDAEIKALKKEIAELKKGTKETAKKTTAKKTTKKEVEKETKTEDK
ncbi:MAG: hypothetical protein IJ086_00770 [Clostridium sp.]|nr:hypothetical protein [Clostridium sp.]